MSDRGELRWRWWGWLGLLGFLTLPAMLSTGLSYMVLLEERPTPFWQVAAWQLPMWYFWAFVTPGILWLARRLPFERGRWGLSLLGHMGLVLAVIALHSAASIPVTKLVAPEPWRDWSASHMFLYYCVRTAPLDLVTYGAVLVLARVFELQRKYRERVVQTSQLETQLAQAQLQALKMQLHPHFLFNTLHAISVLVRKNDNTTAVRMLAGLSDLLRLSLENVGTQEVTLRQELDFLERYLDLEQMRFHDRLQIRLDIDPQTLDAQVPNLILQPLVENAIRHGISAHPSASMVEIRSRRDNGTLYLEVRDDGPGVGALVTDNQRRNGGVGLSNTRKRLRRLYGDEHRFSLSDAATADTSRRGAVATLEIPWRREERA